MVKKEIENPVLQTWLGLNAYIMTVDSEAECKKLLNEERKGRCRRKFMQRIHSRMNKLRSDRERLELEKKINKS